MAAGVAGALVLAVAVGAVAGRRSGDENQLQPPPAAGALESNATVEHVVDGDTVDLIVDGSTQRVRLIGVNTPETVDRRKPVQCFGPEAKQYTLSLLPAGTPVRLERDVEPRDDYGRLLGYVHRAADGLFVNLELVWQGYASPLTIKPNTTHAREFIDAATAAQQAGRGLWAACDG